MKNLHICYSTHTILWIGIRGERKHLTKHGLKISLFFYLLGIADDLLLRTCHWCHVMAHESFEDDEVAEILNKYFVSIKVDKEERSDIDAVYMTVCQALTQQGGWPLTIIMTPDKKPFFAGTYYPKNSRWHLPGLMDILYKIVERWQNDPKSLIASGEEITEYLNRNGDTSVGEVSKKIIKSAKKILAQNFDDENGGFSEKPKFPTPHNILFLLRYAHYEQDKDALAMAEKTLQQMYRGGIYDHIGFGFSRYSTDKIWLVPHFEKMLYDNALLIIAYAEAYQITKRELYKTVAEQIIQYIFREMTDEEGGFYCAQDADSDGKEGKYYIFTPDEIIKILGEKDAGYFNAFFGITEEGNFEDKNIPNLLDNVCFGDKNAKIDQLRQKVFHYRKERTTLHKDDKILTSWNALMIAALAKAYRVFGNSEYLDAAKRAVDFLGNNLMDENFHLHVRFRDGEVSGSGHVDDYAFFIWAMLEMYEAVYDAEYLQKAILLNKILLDEFYDKQKGGFYLYGKSSESLILRPKELYDGAIPSGNSVAAYNLLKLAKYTGEIEYETLSKHQLEYITSKAAGYPAGYSFAMTALMSALYPSRELVCVTVNQKDIQKFKDSINKIFMPNISILVIDDKNADLLNTIAPFTKNYPIKRGSTSYYLCENNNCSPPLHQLEELIQLLK